MQLKGEGKEDHIPMIKPKAGAGKGPSIPDFLMVEPDETTKKLEVQKQQLLEAIKPTEKSISTVWICSSFCVHVVWLVEPLCSIHPVPMMQVMQTPELAQGFDDPEIMKAVEEIAKNPSLIQTKYANNVKVAQFYQAMAGHVGQQLTALGGAGKKVS